MGENLSNTINEAIEELVDDQTSRADVIAQLARAAGISPGTDNQILN